MNVVICLRVILFGITAATHDNTRRYHPFEDIFLRANKKKKRNGKTRGDRVTCRFSAHVLGLYASSRKIASRLLILLLTTLSTIYLTVSLMKQTYINKLINLKKNCSKISCYKIYFRQNIYFTKLSNIVYMSEEI